MKITMIVEGKTEKAFMSYLRNYLAKALPGRMPTLVGMPYHGLIPTGDKLKRVVTSLLTSRTSASDHVIALTDVYTGTNLFSDARDAKEKLRRWVGENTRFHPHAAQYDFEAWLLPYWPTIQKLAKHNQTAPGYHPEQVNHGHPPAHRLEAIFNIGKSRDSYIKPRDAGRILRDNDLSVAIHQCDELKAMINTILSLCAGQPIP